MSDSVFYNDAMAQQRLGVSNEDFAWLQRSGRLPSWELIDGAYLFPAGQIDALAKELRAA